jgi:hypothetical protein
MFAVIQVDQRLALHKVAQCPIDYFGLDARFDERQVQSCVRIAVKRQLSPAGDHDGFSSMFEKYYKVVLPISEVWSVRCGATAPNLFGTGLSDFREVLELFGRFNEN